jgi:cytidine deaminase
VSQEILPQLQEALGRDCYRIGVTRRQQLESELALTTEALLRALVDYAKPRSRCVISKFQVGAAGLTAEGEIFLGVNLEYTQASFAQTVHAEQFLISWSRANSSSPLVTLAVSAPPCGHCRQFMREFDHEGTIRLLIADEPPVTGATLLPRAFTPRDLGIDESFFSAPLALQGVTDLEDAARLAALSSYTPYSGMKAGVAVRARDGRILAGSSLENAAYNPTLPPFQAALVACHAHGVDPTQLESVVLCQGPCRINYSDQALVLSQSLGVGADRFRVVEL